VLDGRWGRGRAVHRLEHVARRLERLPRIGREVEAEPDAAVRAVAALELQCATPTMMMPNTRCCAPPGTPLGSTDSPSLCCDIGVMTLPDDSLECL